MEYWCNWVCVDVRVLRWRGLLNMTHYFDVISLLQAFRSWRQRTIPTVQHMKQAMMQSVAESSKYMQNSLFSLDSTMPWLSWVSCLDKQNWILLKTTQKYTQTKLDEEAFLLYKRRLCRLKQSVSPYNLPLSKGTNYSQWRLLISYSFSACFAAHENLHSLPEVVSRVFSPESTPLVIQQSPLPR